MRPPESAFDHLRRLNDARVIGSPRPGPIRGEKLSNLALSPFLSLALHLSCLNFLFRKWSKNLLTFTGDVELQFQPGPGGNQPGRERMGSYIRTWSLPTYLPAGCREDRAREGPGSCNWCSIPGFVPFWRFTVILLKVCTSQRYVILWTISFLNVGLLILLCFRWNVAGQLGSWEKMKRK